MDNILGWRNSWWSATCTPSPCGRCRRVIALHLRCILMRCKHLFLLSSQAPLALLCCMAKLMAFWAPLSFPSTRFIWCLNPSFPWPARLSSQLRHFYFVSKINTWPEMLWCHWIKHTWICLSQLLNREIIMDEVIHLHLSTKLCYECWSMFTWLSTHLPQPTTACLELQINCIPVRWSWWCRCSNFSCFIATS